MQNEMDIQRVILIISSLSVTSIIQSDCVSCPSCETIHFHVNQNVMTNFAMEGRKIVSEHVPSVFDCFVRCQKNCLCESFNFWRSQESGGLCELNREDFHGDPSSVKKTNGSLFYNLHRQISPGCPDCPSRLSCCTSSNPCLNDGVCIDSCQQTGKRYKCQCRPDYFGPRCLHFNNN